MDTKPSSNQITVNMVNMGGSGRVPMIAFDVIADAETSSEAAKAGTTGPQGEKGPQSEQGSIRPLNTPPATAPAVTGPQEGVTAGQNSAHDFSNPYLVSPPHNNRRQCVKCGIFDLPHIRTTCKESDWRLKRERAVRNCMNEADTVRQAAKERYRQNSLLEARCSTTCWIPYGHLVGGPRPI
jgi:hypothetical protein